MSITWVALTGSVLLSRLGTASLSRAAAWRRTGAGLDAVIHPGFPGGSIAWKEDGVMADSRGTHPSQKRYPPELREWAVRMAQETIE
jgi:hypothetical protein